MAAKDSPARKRIMEGESKAPLLSPVRFTSGCTLVDLVIGGGRGMGWKAGTLINIVALEGGGKTQLSAETIAHNFHARKDQGFWHRFIDREHRFSFDTESMFRMTVCDPSEWVPDTIEELDGYLSKLLNDAKAPGIVVVDSLDAFSTEETEERSEKRMKQVDDGKDIKQDGSYTVTTGAPKFLSESLRITMSKASATQTAVFLLSQVRTKLGAMAFDPNKFNRNGGKALDHWCDTIAWLKPLRKLSVGSEKDGTYREIGAVVNLWTTKSSTPRPYRECMYTLLFDYGIDNIASNIDFLFNLRDHKTGALRDPYTAPTGAFKDVEKEIVVYWKEGAEKTRENVQAWLETIGRLQDAKDARKSEKGNTVFTLAWLDEWIARDQELQAAYIQQFPCYTRDQLIRAVEADPEMERELGRRVVDKWNQIEAQAASNRRSKFNG